MSERTPFQFSLRTLLVVTTVVALLAFGANQFRLLPSWQQVELVAILLWIVVPGAIAMMGAAGGWIAAQRSPLPMTTLWPAVLLSGPNWLFFAVVRATFYLTRRWDLGQEMPPALIVLQGLDEIHGFDVLVVLFQLALIAAGMKMSSARTSFIGVAIALFWITVICVALLSCAISGIHLGGLA